jgi:hypothetical protein
MCVFMKMNLRRVGCRDVNETCGISSSRGGEFEDWSLLGYSAV